MEQETPTNEVQKIRDRYARRQRLPEVALYNPINPSVYMSQQEKERSLIRWINTAGLAPVQDKRVLEIGCGSGDNLLQFLRLGFQPENLVGNELLEERAIKARRLLPASTQVIVKDASELDLAKNSFDIVFQSTVFTSILDKNFQQKLANHLWSLVKPGGGVLWYDFTFDNPNNSDVKGVPVRRICELFPEGSIKVWRLTLAPPLSRRLTKVHPSLYSLLNCLPFLRTHVLCWIKK